MAAAKGWRFAKLPMTSTDACSMQEYRDEAHDEKNAWPDYRGCIGSLRAGCAMIRFELPSSIWRAIVEHMQAALPAEGCGLLAVPTVATAVVRAVRFYPGTNILRSPTRFVMHPREVQAALDDMERHGWQLGAIVHSHPTSPPSPSPIDLREAYYPDALMLIVSLGGDGPLLQAWRLERNGKTFDPVAVPVVVGEAGEM